MTIVDLLERNAAQKGAEVALVEINPELPENRRRTWREYDLVEPAARGHYRREITWSVFNEKANRFANLLISRGIKKGDKVAILLMNCLEWLPIYFGILKTGALVVPLNYRYTAEEIRYCLDLADIDALVFGPEFVSRMDVIANDLPTVSMMFFVGKEFEAGKAIENVSILDIAPTIAKIMGVPAPREWEGKALV